MSDINISIDSSDVKTVKQEIDSLRRSFTSAQASASVFSSAFESAIASQVQELDRVYGAFNRVARANQDVINGNLGISNSYKDAASSAEVFARAMLEADRRKADTAFALGAQRAKEEAKATEDLVRTQQKLANEAERLRQKYDTVYSVSTLYERSLNELNRAQELGVLSARKHAAAVDALNKEFQDFQNGTAQFGNRFTQHMNQSSRGLNEFGFVAQQIGYQVGDFFVQVQSGTNVLVAFGQQATQLAGLIPGVWGAVAGIGISALTALGAAWMRTREETDRATGSARTYADTLKDLQQTSRSLSSEMEMLRFGVDTEAEAEALRQILDLERQRAELAERWKETQSLGERQRLAEESAELQKQLAAQKAIVEEVKRKREELDKANLIARGMAAVELGQARALGQAVAEQKAEAEKVKKEHAAQVVYMGKTVAESDRFVASLTRAYGLMAQTKVAAAQMATNVRNAANAWLVANAPMGTGYLANQYAMYGAGQVASRATIREANPLYGPSPYSEDPTKDSGGTGGVGGASTQTNPWEDLQKELQRQRQLLGLTEQQVSLKEELWRIEDALGEDRGKYSDAQIQSLAQQNLAIKEQLKLQEEANRQMQSLSDTIESSMSDAFMSMVDGTASVKDAFKSMAADIIKQLYQVLVVQRLVSGITDSIGISTGASTGSFGLPFGRESGGTMMAGKPYLVGERGPELVVPRHSGTVVNANQTSGALGGGSGTTVVNNNISVTGSDAAMVRAEVAKMIPQIASATKAAVIDAKQRGGQMAAAFR